MFTNRYLKNSTDPVYSVGQINSYPTTTYAVQVVTTLAYACKLPLKASGWDRC